MNDNDFSLVSFYDNLAVIKDSLPIELHNYLCTLSNEEHIRATIENHMQYIKSFKGLNWLYSTL